MWRAIDKENTPPLERRGPRPITPPPDYERRIATSSDDVRQFILRQVKVEVSRYILLFA